MNKPIFIIGEIGINHNGDLGIAKELMDLAIDTGADAIKFQKRAIN
jgi:N-acetylneuraminate synthase